MKIDRFVKIMLVLIALLLAINCVSNFSNSSDSRGNVSSSPGNSGTKTPGSSRTPLIENKVEAASPPQYKAAQINQAYIFNANSVQAVLDQMSAQGWEYVGSVETVMVFKK